MSSGKLWLYKLLTWWLPESRCFCWKCALLRWTGAKVGRNVRIYSSAKFFGNGALTIGDDVHIGAEVIIYPVSPAEIMIGSHVDVGPGVMLLTGGHAITPDGERIAGEGIVGSVEIGKGSWLGARTTVLAGVRLPEKTITAAGAVVTKTFETKKALLAGIPAVEKKTY